MKLAVACLVLTGCFYIDPINRRPRVDPITCRVVNSDDRACANNAYLHHDDQVELAAVVFDSDGEVSKATYDWTANACSDVDAAQCDPVAYFSSHDVAPTVGWPNSLAGVRSIRINVDVRDDRGALVSQTAKFYVNDPPTLELHTAARLHAVGAPMVLTSTYGDLDEGPMDLQVVWDVVSPIVEPPATLEDVASAAEVDPTKRTVSKRLVPSVAGTWEIRVTATDRLRETTTQHLVFDVGPDQPPCLAQVQPIVPPDGAALPIVEPTVFQVPLVDDELDGYPRRSSDPAFGTTTFAWSILRPGASARQPLIGATGNSLDFDPAAFTPGQRVELRVEIFDRNHAAVLCADAAPTCATADRPACLQRQTWRVEVR